MITWKGYCERELFCITTILEPIVKIYEECLWVHLYSVEMQAGEQRRNWDSLLLACLVYINISVGSSFLSFTYDFFIHICFGFEKTKLTKGKIYGELWPLLKYNFKEGKWIFRLRRRIWLCGICRLKFSAYWVILTTTKTGYNIRKS